MRFIQKGPPPSVIAELRRTPDASWAGVAGDQKEAMRAALRVEQRGLCAYCNRRLPEGAKTSVEHWSARSDPQTDPFAWQDLLAVCEGLGEGPTCDRRRGDESLRLHPARRPPDVEVAVRFYKDGRLRPADAQVEQECEQLLGLSDPVLVRARKEVANVVLERLAAAQARSAGDLAREVRKLREAFEANTGVLPPHPRVVVPLLDQAERRAEALKARPRGR